MNFLNQVVQQKQKEAAALKRQYSDNAFVKLFQKSRPPILIAEIKPKSPSSGVLHRGDVVELAKTYQKAGADAISVLTDKEFFGGSPALFQRVKNVVEVPLLRKDFIISREQLVESLLIGADAVLLIAGILREKQLKDLIDFSLVLGIAPAVEVFNERELQKALGAGAEIIGVNSRNLKTMTVDKTGALKVLKSIPETATRLLFSGIATRQDVIEAAKAGARGVLVGTALLQAQSPRKKLKELKGKL